ncbi:MAG: TonB-dependent receptor [Gemmatimonadota bacterium]
MARGARMLIVLPLMTAAALPLAGQAPTAEIIGVVRDSASEPLADVDVLALSRTTGFAYRVSTSSSGRYWLRGLPPGGYDLTAGRIGLRATTREGVRLSIGQTITIDFTLHPSAVELEPLSVRVGGPPLETTNSEVSYVLDRQRIEQLPEEARQFIELAQLVPGATAGTVETGGPPPFGTNGTSVGALNRQSLGVLVDGGDFTEGLFGDLNGSLPLLAIQEFEVVQSQYSAELGRAASGIINVATRSGGNELHGEAFGLYRHQTLTALGAFETEKPDFNRSHWGAALGGPISAGRTHFFAAFERRAENTFSTVNTGGAFPGFEGTFKTPFTDNLLFARIDHRAGEGHELTLRYSGEIGEELFGVGGTSALEYGQNNTLDMHSVLVAHRWMLPSGWLNEARLHVISTQRSLLRNASPGPTLFYPSLSAGPHQGEERSRSLRAELRDDVSLISTGRSGTHRVSFGTHLSWLDNETQSAFFEDGAFFFREDTDPLPARGQISFDPPAIELDARNLQLAFYAQDDWSPTPGLTLALGLRYDIETNGTNQDFVSPFAGQVSFIPTFPRSIDKDNLAPRIGFAWDPTGGGRTVVRGGFGIFYDASIAAPQVALERSSGVPVVQVFNPATTAIDELMIDPDTVPPVVWTSAEIETAMTRQSSLGIEHSLPGEVIIRIDGLFVQGRNLLLERNLNPIEGGAPRHPEFAQILQMVSAGRADAKMLLVEMRKAFPRGWVNVGYTLADRKNTNDNWGADVPQNDPDVLDLDGEWGPAAWDERHRVVATGGIGLPLDVTVAAKVIYASARPFTAITGRDDNGDLDRTNDRPPGEGRNARRGPDFFRTDVGLTWSALTSGRARIGLALNVYNLFNTTNGLPNSVPTIVGSPLFGQAAAAFPGRQLELGVRVGPS